jgi:hypothetical protein
MTSKNLYLDAWDTDINYEIIVVMVANLVDNLNMFNDEELSAASKSLASEYEKNGITLIRSEPYAHNQEKYLKIYISQPQNDRTVYGLQYYTVYDHKAISITLHSYSEQLSSIQEEELQKIVDSVVFQAAPQAAGSTLFQSIAPVLKFSIIAVVIMFLFIIAAAVMTFVLIRKNRKKLVYIPPSSPQTDGNRESIRSDLRIPDAPIDQNRTGYPFNRPTVSAIHFCHICGSELEPGGAFCNHCGTEVPRGPGNR